MWAEKQKLDSRVTNFIASNPDWLDGNVADRPQIDSGLEKFPDHRAWKKVSDIILHISTEEKNTAAANLKKYSALLESGSNKESLAHFTSVFSQGMYPSAVAFIVANAMEVYQK